MTYDSINLDYVEAPHGDCHRIKWIEEPAAMTITNSISDISIQIGSMGISVQEAIESLQQLQEAMKSLTYRTDHIENDVEDIKEEQKNLRSYIEPASVEETENPKQKGVLEILNVKMDEIYKNILNFDFLPSNMFLN